MPTKEMIWADRNADIERGRRAMREILAGTEIAMTDQWRKGTPEEQRLAEGVRATPPEIGNLKLKKRPVAFRVRNTTNNAWVLFEHEDAANGYSELWKTQVQGLYVRDGASWETDEIERLREENALLNRDINLLQAKLDSSGVVIPIRHS